jgi:hypothetical protein
LEDDQKAQLKAEVFQNTQLGSQFLELSGSHLFRKRLRSRFQDDLTKLSMKDLKDALDHLEDPEFLAESSLGSFQSISLQIANDVPNSSARRGMLVRDLLKKAFEKMRPSDIRNDSALEWRSYNILWYHYFKYHLPNQHTAARLGIGSLRQFYREQEKAIQALLREVLDLEANALSRMK